MIRDQGNLYRLIFLVVTTSVYIILTFFKTEIEFHCKNPIFHRNNPSKLNNFTDLVNASYYYENKITYLDKSLFNKRKKLQQQIVSKFAVFQTLFFGHTLLRENTTLYKIKDSYFSSNGILNGDNFYLAQRYYRPIKFTNFTCNCRFTYKKVVLAFSYHLEFGHFLSDMICSLIQYPKEIIKGAQIFIPFSEKPAKMYCKVLGFDTDKIHELSSDWLYSEKIFVLHPEEGINAMSVVGFAKLREIFARNLNLDPIRPKDHVFLNRIKGIWGRINNIEELIFVAKEMYPKILWKQLDDMIVYNVSKVAKALAATKVLVTTAGSMCFNSVFMKSGTGIYSCGTAMIDFPALMSAFVGDIWMVYQTMPIKHGLIDYVPFNPDAFGYTLAFLMTAVEKGKWPENSNDFFVTAFPLIKLKREVRQKKPSTILKFNESYPDRKIINLVNATKSK